MRGDYVIAPPFNSKVPREIPRDWGRVVGRLMPPPAEEPSFQNDPPFGEQVRRSQPRRLLLVSFDSSRYPMVFSPSEVTTIEYDRTLLPNHGCG